MKVANPAQVAVTVYHSSLRSLEIIWQYKDQEIDKHLSIASEYIKYISHNQPYKVVERIEKMVKEIEGKLNDHVTKISSSLKQLNTTTQKADNAKSKLSALENRVGKLKKVK